MPRAHPGAYVGIDLDEVDSPQVPTSAASLRSQSSSLSLLPGRTRKHSGFAAPRPSPKLRHMRIKDIWRQVIPQTKTFFAESFADLKAISGRNDLRKDWRHLVWRFVNVFFPILLIGMIIGILPVITSKKLYTINDACLPDSGFFVGFGEYNIWDASGFFQITLGFGEFSFTAAKAIDVGWDVSIIGFSMLRSC
jgi:hypothetical protein